MGTRLNMTFAIDADGDLLYSSKVPVQGEQRLKCVDGASVEIRLLGARMLLQATWVGEGALALAQTTTSGKKTTTSTITLKYDELNDKIVSENDSAEGFYLRVFKRA